MEQSWQICFPYCTRALHLQVQDVRKGRQETTWLNWDLLVKLESKKKMHRQWKQGQVNWKEYRDAVWGWGQEGQGPPGTGLVKGRHKARIKKASVCTSAGKAKSRSA